jgi:hypothetical protein
MRFSVSIVAALIASSLAGCQTIKDAVTGAESESDPQADVDAAQTSIAPSNPIVAGPRATTVSGGLAGMTADGLRAAWGEPVLKRTETGSELWQYGGPDCALLVYLYPGSGSAMTVSHAEAIPGGADESAIAACAKAAGKPSLKPVS